MDGGQLTAIIIVAIVMLASIVRASVRGPRHPVTFGDGQAKVENERLRDEVSQLKERLKVLERITVEKENSLSKEIESLRDR
jgi:methyl coenzyme M reductase subunit D